MPIFFVLLVIFVFGSLFATSFRDPGVLPRGPPPPALTAKPDAEADQLPDNYPLGHGPLPPLVIHEYTVNGRTVKTRYCDTCRIPRPPRVHHCRECDSCVGTSGSNEQGIRLNARGGARPGLTPSRTLAAPSRPFGAHSRPLAPADKFDHRTLPCQSAWTRRCSICPAPG